VRVKGCLLRKGALVSSRWLGWLLGMGMQGLGSVVAVIKGLGGAWGSPRKEGGEWVLQHLCLLPSGAQGGFYQSWAQRAVSCGGFIECGANLSV